MLKPPNFRFAKPQLAGSLRKTQLASRIVSVSEVSVAPCCTALDIRVQEKGSRKERQPGLVAASDVTCGGKVSLARALSKKPRACPRTVRMLGNHVVCVCRPYRPYVS
eukprot:7033200-Prymnesium_polylepis.1